VDDVDPVEVGRPRCGEEVGGTAFGDDEAVRPEERLPPVHGRVVGRVRLRLNDAAHESPGLGVLVHQERTDQLAGDVQRRAVEEGGAERGHVKKAAAANETVTRCRCGPYGPGTPPTPGPRPR